MREHITGPLLRELGYRVSTTNDILFEQPLRLPFAQLGRRKKSDPQLVGIPDYILEVDRRLRWVLDAKAPNPITDHDRAQAFYYARHHEVKAIYYALCNGRVFEVFLTDEAPNRKHLLQISFEELHARFHELVNLLSPASLKRDYRELKVDTGRPLAPGLRSVARLFNGTITYEEFVPENLFFKGMQVQIAEGSLERNPEGHIPAYMKVRSFNKRLDDVLGGLGLDVYDMVTDADEISNDPSSPTRFTNERQVTYPAGTNMPNVQTGDDVVLAVDLIVKITSEACVYLSGNHVRGTFSALFNYLAPKELAAMNMKARATALIEIA